MAGPGMHVHREDEGGLVHFWRVVLLGWRYMEGEAWD